MDGGGVNINSKILPSLPPTAKENDIVIISSATSNSIVVDTDAPTNLPVNGGFVEHGTHLSGKPTITLREEPAVKMTLRAAYQKTATALESREAYVYSGGKFLKFSSLAVPGSGLPDPASTKILIRDPNTRYYGAPIVWRLADKNHYAYDNNYPQNALTLISEYILCFKPFDADEPKNTVTEFRNNGNSTYSLSNIHQWLNSDAAAGKWYTAKHTYDMPPATVNLKGGNNPYDNEAGFLNGFSTQFKSKMLSARFGVVLPQGTTEKTEYVTAKVALPSVQEVGGPPMYLSVSAGFTIFREIGSGNSEKRYVTATPEALSHATTVVTPNSKSGSFEWILRTPYNPESGYSGGRSIRTVGEWYGETTSSTYPYEGKKTGIRPVCNIPNTTQFVKASDGIYDIVW